MTCPHCGSNTSSVEIETTDGQVTSIDECLNCGGHFLAPVLANFISSNTAKNIDSVIPKQNALPATSPTCPHCHQVMSSIKDDAVPQTVTVFSCPNNHGEFYPQGQLFLFKKAQQAKINYHKLWGIPLKTAFSIIIPVMIVFSAITVIPNLIQFNQVSQETRIKASEIVTPPLITPISSNQVLISFSTVKSAKTTITFTAGLQETYTVSESPSINHLLSLENITPATTYRYIINIDSDGKTVSTSEYTFTTP